MKRGAEKQLSKDDDRDDEVEETQSGIQIAKESELAKREIRGLPKRRSPAVTPGIPPASTTTQPAVPQRFGSFSGFGAPGGAATPFTFAPSPLAAPQKPVDAPAVSESASSATKKFASFLGPSSTVGAKPVRSSSSETARPDASGDTDEVALKYYTSLRGLNSSFLSAVSKAIESDPFFDVADILEQYKKHRISVQQDYDGKSSPARTQSAPSPPSKPSMSAASFSFLKPATSTPATMPAPPSSFASFAAPSNSATPATGFTPGPAAPTTEPSPSPFGFSSRSASSDPKSASSASSAPFSSLASGTSSSSLFKPPGSREAESDSLKPAFSVGAFASAGPTSGASPFGSGGSLSSSTSLFGNPPKTSTLFSSDKAAQEEKDKEKDKPASSVLAPATFSFSLPTTTKLFSDTSSGSGSIFGASTTTKSAEDKDKEKEKEKGLPSLPPPSSIFGGTFGASPAKPSPFAFGTGSSPTPASFGFGVVPGGSEGSSPPRAGSVGFSFGSPTRAGSQTAAATTAPSSVFGLASMPTSSSASASAATPPGAPGAGTAGSTPASTTASTPTPAVPAAGATSSLLDVPSSAAASRGDTPATEGSVEEDGLARTMSPGLHGGEGEGEEDEETTYTVKSKVYKFTTDREGVPTWSEMGIGMLRLKKHKETNARRVILRSSTTGKIIINFRIYPGLQPKRAGKSVAFTGHITSPGKETQTVQYRLRVGTEAAATEMTEAIEREVRLVQTESSPST